MTKRKPRLNQVSKGQRRESNFELKEIVPLAKKVNPNKQKTLRYCRLRVNLSKELTKETPEQIQNKPCINQVEQSTDD